MRKDKTVEISVKTVFAGRKSKEQAFYDLLLLNPRGAMVKHGLDSAPQTSYTNGMVFPMYTPTERGNCYE